MIKEKIDIRISELMPELYPDWLTIPFEDAIEPNSGSFTKLKQKQTKKSGKFPVVDQGENAINGYVDDEALLYKGKLPVIIFGDHSRRLKFIDFKFAVGADGTKLLVPKKFLLPKFFFYFLKTVRINSDGYSRHYKYLREIRVPVPPMQEQKKIVARLESLIFNIENNNKRFEKIPALLNRMRQAILSIAVNGDLTEDWRKDNGIMEEWLFMKAFDACHTVASGSTPKNKPFYPKEEIPYLKVYNIVDQKIDFFYKPQYIKRAIHDKELKRCKVYPDDVIINIVGPPLGKVAIVPNTFSEWNINQAIVVFRPKKFLFPMFLYYVLCDGKQIKDIELELRGTAGQSNISLTQCRNFDLPIPKPEEQIEIIRRVEKLLAIADGLQIRYEKAKAILDKIPQSVLAKAFRGELISQGPDDEPASVLLEKIKLEKATQIKGNSSKRNKVLNL